MNENWRGGKETESFARRIREMETEKVCAGNNRKFLGRGGSFGVWIEGK